MSMMRSITIGHYLPGDSLVHRLDPRVKLISLIVLLVALFNIKTFVGFSVFGLFMALLVFTGGVPLRYLVRGLKPILFIALFTIIVHFFFTKGGMVLVRVGALTIESDGLYTGTFMTLRLVLLVLSTTLVTLTTSPIALTDGIEHLLAPFRRIGVPAHEISMMMTIALRFIPTLMEESDKIMKAQMARGANFDEGNIFQRARSLIPLMVPLFVSAFRRADELATAMEARCYRGGQKRTRLRELKAYPRDYYSLGAVILFAVIIIFGGI